MNVLLTFVNKEDITGPLTWNLHEFKRLLTNSCVKVANFYLVLEDAECSEAYVEKKNNILDLSHFLQTLPPPQPPLLKVSKNVKCFE